MCIQINKSFDIYDLTVERYNKIQQNIQPFILVSSLRLTFDICSVITKVNIVVYIISVNVKVFRKISNDTTSKRHLQ